MGSTSGRASSGTHPWGQRACSPEPLKVAATPPHRPPAHPDRPAWLTYMSCVDGDRREGSRLPMSTQSQPASLPAR